MPSDLFQLMMGRNNPVYGSTNSSKFPASTVIGDAPGFNPATTGNYDPYTPNKQLNQLLDTRNTYRNLNVANNLDELGKDYTNIFAAGPSDALVDAYRNRRGILDSSLQARGLEYTGARNLADKALQQFYGKGIIDITSGSKQQELGRQQGLISNLQRILGEDQQVQDALSNIYLQGQEVRNQRKAKSNADAVRQAGLYKGIVQLGASILGAAYGAGGGLSGGSTTGVAGGLQGLNAANGLFGDGGGGYYPQMQSPPGTVENSGLRSNYSIGRGNPFYDRLNTDILTRDPNNPFSLLNASLYSTGEVY